MGQASVLVVLCAVFGEFKCTSSVDLERQFSSLYIFEPLGFQSTHPKHMACMLPASLSADLYPSCSMGASITTTDMYSRTEINNCARRSEHWRSHSQFTGARLMGSVWWQGRQLPGLSGLTDAAFPDTSCPTGAACQRLDKWYHQCRQPSSTQLAQGLGDTSLPAASAKQQCQATVPESTGHWRHGQCGSAAHVDRLPFKRNQPGGIQQRSS